MNFLYNYAKSFMTEEEGQTFTEYALVLVIICLGLAAISPGVLLAAIEAAFQRIADAVDNAGS